MPHSASRSPITLARNMFQDPAHGLFDKEMELPLPAIPLTRGRLVVPHPEAELHRILKDTLAEDEGYAEPPPRLVSPSSSSPSVTDDSLPPTPSYGPPVNFARVPGPAVIYRSSFPQPANFEHLAQLGLATVLTLVADAAHPREHRDFLARGGIRHLTVAIPAHKRAGDRIPGAAMAAALRVLRDPAHHPLLVHCNKGKHRTGCVVGAWRKAAGWAMPDVLKEYRRYAGAKARPLDEEYLAALLFDAEGEPLEPAASATTNDSKDE